MSAVRPHPMSARRAPLDGRVASPRAAPVVPRGLAWSAAAAIATIVAGLLAMALVPLQHARRATPLRAGLATVVEPARADITALHLALAGGEAALRDWREAHLAARAGAPPDSALLRLFRREAREVGVLVGRLDARVTGWEHAAVDRWVDSVRVATARWQASGETLAAAPWRGAPGAAREARHADDYTAALVSAARLDASVARGAQRVQTELEAYQRAAGRWTVGLAVLALAGVAAALWLGLAVRRGALLAESRRQALADAMESKARFTRGLSHDLKNPLGAIDGHAALLAEEIYGPVTADQRDALARIRRAVRSLLALVDDLLALARAESGELAVCAVPLDVHALLREVAEEQRAALVRAELAFDALVPDAPRAVCTDGARLRQIVGNLLTNSRKYTPAGGRVSLTVIDGDRSVQVAVADTGPGIPADRREFVFQEFSRLPGTSAPGAGLGLAISRRIARLLGGELWADAVPPGAGARFVLELPCDPPRAPQPGAWPPLGSRRAVRAAPEAGATRTDGGGV